MDADGLPIVGRGINLAEVMLTLYLTVDYTFKKHLKAHCFLLPTMYNNCFTQFYSLFYTPGTYILVCSADHGLV